MSRWRTAAPGSGFREAKRERGLSVVREAADLWARDGRAAVAEPVVLAVLVRILVSREAYSYFQLQGSASSGDAPALPLKPLQEWGAIVGTPVVEIRLATSDQTPLEVQSLVDSCVDVVKSAADEWALGDPEKPATESVFRHLAQLLDSRGLIPWWGEKPGARS